VKKIFVKIGEKNEIIPKDQVLFHSVLNQLHGIDCEMTITKTRQRRSNNANAYMWIVFTVTAEWTCREGSTARYNKDQIHDLVLQEVGYQMMPDGRKIPRRTSSMNSLEFSEFLKAAKVFLRETFDVPYIPEPEDVYT